MTISCNRLIVFTVLSLSVFCLHAEDWGAYSIVPVSAPNTVLEVVDAGKTEGTSVSINKFSSAAHQKWVVTQKENGDFSIKPVHAPTLALTAGTGDAKNGLAVTLEKDESKPSQLWQLTKHENGSYSLIPKSSPTVGLDDFGGKQEPGSKIDLWAYTATDPHLQWFIKPLAGSGATVAAAPEAAHAYVPPVIKPEDIKAGEIKTFQFKQSKVYPGTVRDVTVFIPAQYDGSKPACVYVKTDGFNAREKTFMETMIATKEMPVTVGVFVRPGSLPAPMKGTLDRRNRCFEYDGVGDENVRFLTEELLPYISKELNLKLSESGNDRCISGGSSGGIAAFTAAWNQPDAFSRVYAASGSWVAFRGGHEFPTWVRKYEAKPIRAYLTTGMRDMENCAGDWYLLDQEMDKALKFSGYDYQFRIINGGHVAGYMENYQEALAYLWRGWPEPVKAGPSAPRAQEIIVPGQGWEVALEGVKEPRGPASNAAGEVFFISNNQIQRIDAD